MWWHWSASLSHNHDDRTCQRTWRWILMPVPRVWQKALYWTLVDQLPITIPSRSFTCTAPYTNHYIHNLARTRLSVHIHCGQSLTVKIRIWHDTNSHHCNRQTDCQRVTICALCYITESHFNCNSYKETDSTIHYTLCTVYRMPNILSKMIGRQLNTFYHKRTHKWGS